MGRKLSGVPITGYTANAATLLNVDLEAGRFFTPAEEDHSAAVAVIGYDVKDQLFPTLDPIGRTIYVNGYPLTVIGLQSKLGNVLGQNRDKRRLRAPLVSPEGDDVGRGHLASSSARSPA